MPNPYISILKRDLLEDLAAMKIKCKYRQVICEKVKKKVDGTLADFIMQSIEETKKEHGEQSLRRYI